MRASRRQFLRGELSGQDALRCNGTAWSVKARIGMACPVLAIAMEQPAAIAAEV
jgi:hypothetical protein